MYSVIIADSGIRPPFLYLDRTRSGRSLHRRPRKEASRDFVDFIFHLWFLGVFRGLERQKRKPGFPMDPGRRMCSSRGFLGGAAVRRGALVFPGVFRGLERSWRQEPIGNFRGRPGGATNGTPPKKAPKRYAGVHFCIVTKVLNQTILKSDHLYSV